MTFTENDKLKAMAIVHIFETSRPFGDFAACVVLNDGAGVSYGINQFTHRSGSLAAVVQSYLSRGGQIGRDVLNRSRLLLKTTSPGAINELASDQPFKRALRAAAATAEMRAAQTEIAIDRYLAPAIRICEERGFTLPLSLAVVYDSVTHGSWEWISAKVGRVCKPHDDLQAGCPHSNEKAWIAEYVRQRHAWLTELARLRATNYRTRFFREQIAANDWELRLPFIVHGVKLTPATFEKLLPSTAEANVADADKAITTGKIDGSDAETNGPAREVRNSSEQIAASGKPTLATEESRPNFPAGPTGPSDTSTGPDASLLSEAVDKFDRVNDTITAVTTRTDAAKSLWTTIGGTAWQSAWAVFGFIVGLPKTVWIVVAILAAALMLAYLYRQIELGKIREAKG